MHGLINRAIEEFARGTYGDEFWQEVVQRCDLGVDHFEAMMSYEPQLTGRVLEGLAAALDTPRAELLEDIGTFLVSSGTGAIRRLLRFSGLDFVDFLHALDDLPARARLAVPELDMPHLRLDLHTPCDFALTVCSPFASELRFGHVMIGLLRAMADDYGALVYLDYKGGRGATEMIAIRLLETAFAEGRAFDLGASA